MFYSQQGETKYLHFHAYQFSVSCWRCWAQFTAFAPTEFEDLLLFRCDSCGNTRALETYGAHNYTGLEELYIQHHPDTVRSGHDHMKEFLYVFEMQWVESCDCGGRFRLKAPIRCPKCRAQELKPLRGKMQKIESPPVPILKISIPESYRGTSVPGSEGTR